MPLHCSTNSVRIPTYTTDEDDVEEAADYKTQGMPPIMDKPVPQPNPNIEPLWCKLQPHQNLKVESEHQHIILVADLTLN